MQQSESYTISGDQLQQANECLRAQLNAYMEKEQAWNEEMDANRLMLDILFKVGLSPP